MGRTYKDAKQNRVLEVVKRQDGTFDLFLNRRLYRGYYGEEYDPIRVNWKRPEAKSVFLMILTSMAQWGNLSVIALFSTVAVELCTSVEYDANACNPTKE